MVCFLEPNVDFYTNNYALAREVKDHFGGRVGKGGFLIKLHGGRRFYAVHNLVQGELLRLLAEIEGDHKQNTTYSVKISGTSADNTDDFVSLRANFAGRIRTVHNREEIREIMKKVNKMVKLESKLSGK